MIVAKMLPEAERKVTEIFAGSDCTELPYVAGVRRHPEFARVSERLSAYITPYLPTWRSPKDAQAKCFYDWTPGGEHL